jgi:hypothetical protein
MARPPRASSASTKIIGFRLTEEEEGRLDELVADLGHKDRSALLRSWLAQGGPEPRRAAAVEQPPPAESIEDLPPAVYERVYAALRREHDPHLGLIRVPSLVRRLAPRTSVEQVHALLRALQERGVLELRPDAGGEFLRDEDSALCPRGPRGTVFSFARWAKNDAGERS